MGMMDDLLLNMGRAVNATEETRVDDKKADTEEKTVIEEQQAEKIDIIKSHYGKAFQEAYGGR